MPARIVIERMGANKYMMRVYSSRGEMLLSGSIYKTKKDALESARRFRNIGTDLDYYHVDETENGFQLRVSEYKYSDQDNALRGTKILDMKRECKRWIIKVARALVSSSVTVTNNNNMAREEEYNYIKYSSNIMEVRNRIRSVLRCIKRQEKKDDIDYTYSSYRYFGNNYEEYLCNAVMHAWRPIYRSIESLSDFNRKGEMFGGFPWTSDSFPWPVDESGKPYIPLAQIDIGKAGQRIKKHIDDGILQLWYAADQTKNHSFIRVIPYNVLNDEVAHDRYLVNENEHLLWGYNFDVRGVDIVDWIKNGVMFDSSINMAIGDEGELIPCKALIDRFYEDYWHIRNIESQRTFLFGIPNPVQDDFYTEYSNGWESLLQVTGDVGFETGDGARGHLYYRTVNGKAQYKFDWSCY